MSNIIIDTNNYYLPKGFSLASGSFTIDKLIGVGDFSYTYSSYSLNEYYVIKELFIRNKVIRDSFMNVKPVVAFNDSFEKTKKLFLEEVANIKKSQNPHLSKICSVFSENNTVYYVTPWINGTSLEDSINDKKKYPFDDANRLLIKLIDAIESLHKNHVIHKDICPKNIIIDNNYNPIIVDYGCGKIYDKDFAPLHLNDGFSALEQYTGFPTIGFYTDIYSLAAIYYYIISGERLDSANTRGLNSIKSLCSFNSEVNPNIDLAIQHGLAVFKPQRPQTIRQWGIRHLLEENKNVIETTREHTKNVNNEELLFKHINTNNNNNNEYNPNPHIDLNTNKSNKPYIQSNQNKSSVIQNSTQDKKDKNTEDVVEKPILMVVIIYFLLLFLLFLLLSKVQLNIALTLFLYATPIYSTLIFRVFNKNNPKAKKVWLHILITYISSLWFIFSIVQKL